MAEQISLDVVVGQGIKYAVKEFKDLQTAVKGIDFAFRQQKISAKELVGGLTAVNTAAAKLNLTQKQSVDLNAQIFQVQQRAVYGFNSMSKSLHEAAQASNRSQQGFMALAYIIQDMPYGIRGVANNITQLSQVLGTPIWINMAISAFTSLAVVMSMNKKGAGDLKSELADLGSEMTKIYEGLDRLPFASVLAMKQSRLGVAKDQLAEAAKKAMVEERYLKGYKTSAKGDSYPVYGTRIVSAKDTDEARAYEEAMKKVAQIEVEIANFRDSYAKKEEKRLKIKEIDPKGALGFGTYRASKAKVSAYQFDWREYFAKEQDEALRRAIDSYNSIFFDPLRAGFKSIADEIRQSLFGSLDDLKSKFGNVGAAIIQSLNQVIAKLIETAIAASILSMLFPGAGGFGSIFGKLLFGNSAANILGGGNTPSSMGNNIISGGSKIQMVNVMVQGKLSGGDIYIAGKSYESMQNSVRANG